MSSLDWLRTELTDLETRGLYRRRRKCQPLEPGWCEVDGRRLRDFASNDYLALSSEPRVLAAIAQAAQEAGSGARGSALVCGRGDWQVRLETALAEFEHQPAAILFPTGMAANVGTIAALAGPGDVVFCDRWNHASLVDGCRLSGARLQVYRHDRLESLERHLQKASAARRRFLVTDAVFSMDGDLAPLPHLCDLAERYQAVLIVDEAHGTGVFGERGRGVCELLQVEDRVPIRIGTLSKALGNLGGFVTGSETLIDWLWNRARTQMFSTALPPGVCAGAWTAVSILRQEPERVQRLQELCADFRRQLAAHGIPVLPGSVGPIVPIVVGDADRTLSLAAQLADRGYFVGAIRPPTVAEGTSRLRITVNLSQPHDVCESLARTLNTLLNA